MDVADDLDSGLLGIALSDSDSEFGDNATATATATKKKTSHEARTAQSEVDFRRVKQTYRVKVENGEVRIPTSSSSLVISPPHESCCF